MLSEPNYALGTSWTVMEKTFKTRLCVFLRLEKFKQNIKKKLKKKKSEIKT